MKRKVALIALMVCILLSLKVHAYAQRFANGIGKPNDPYQIATAEQLISIGSDPNLLDKHFILVNDIDLDPNLPGGQVFTRAVIAPDTDAARGFQGAAFTGGFDGNDHSIRNLTIRVGTPDCLGLFGLIGGGRVYDLGLQNVLIIGANDSLYLGGLAGLNGGRITNCYVTGSVSGGDNIEAVGGLVGYNNDGSITNCYATGSVSGGKKSHCLGGLVGDTLSGRIASCYATVSVSGGDSSWGLGGLVGHLRTGTITNCYATDRVSGGGR